MSEHMSDNNDTLRELIQIANDGAQFYADAADQVTNPRLVELFRRMGSHKRVLAAALASKLQAGGEQIPESGTLAGSLRRVYTELRTSLSSNEEAIYVAQLEETEDRLLHHFEAGAMQGRGPAQHLADSHAQGARLSRRDAQLEALSGKGRLNQVSPSYRSKFDTNGEMR